MSWGIKMPGVLLGQHAKIIWGLCSSLGQGMDSKLPPCDNSVWVYLCHYQGKS